MFLCVVFNQIIYYDNENKAKYDLFFKCKYSAAVWSIAMLRAKWKQYYSKELLRKAVWKIEQSFLFPKGKWSDMLCKFLTL